MPVFDSHELIGNTRGKERFQYVCDPGGHTFVAEAQKVTVIQADLLPDQVYDIVVDIGMGWWRANITLEAITRDHERRHLVPEWEANTTLMVFVDDAEAASFEADRRADIDEILADFLRGEKADRLERLTPEDHR